ncbi:hypothetical protein PM082_009772 [Marasmius tenuissimus]|nr:hypothetical protein PM082_009772 [Marasmius tenuissimus]
MNAYPDKIFTKCPAKTLSSPPSAASPAESQSTDSQPGSNPESRKLGTGAKAGIAIGAVALATVGGLFAVLCYRRRQRSQHVGTSGFVVDESLHRGSTLDPFTSATPSQNLVSAFRPLTKSPLPTSTPGHSQQHSISVWTSRSGSGRNTASGNDHRSPPPPMTRKGGITYVHTIEARERHVDAGPLEGESLRRGPSGRLPPAYSVLGRS